MRLQGHYGPDTKMSFVGNLAHRIFSRHLEKGPIAEDEFAVACRQEIGASGLNHKMGPLEIKPSTLEGVIEEVRGLYARFVDFPGEGFKTSEFAIDHLVPGSVRLVGSIDAVFVEEAGGHRLIDWKTGELGEAADQLFFYAFLWAVEHDEVPAGVEAVSVRTGERFHTVPTSQDLESVSENVADLVNEMRRGWAAGTSLDRRGGPWCRYCPVLEDCDEGRSVTALLG